MTIQLLAKYAPMTLLLLALFVGYAVIQLILGVSLDNPSSHDLVRFGANFLPKTVTDEPWRLLSAGFLHIGVMHLLFNGFAIYFFGQVAEPVFGKWRFLAVFFLSVMAGNLLSLYVTWQGFLSGLPISVGAGASGGIMGIGLSLVALSYSQHPFAKILNKKSLIVVMALNLIMGFALPNIDNAAHIGGAVCGGVLGAVFAREPLKYPSLYSAIVLPTKPITMHKSTIATATVTALLVSMWYGLHQMVQAHIG